MFTCHRPIRYFRILAILMVLAMCLAPIASTAGPVVAQQGNPPNVPYDLPVQLPPAGVTSPSVDANAPYTPVVLSLLAQLLPSNPPTQTELANASLLLVYGKASLFDPPPPGCYGTGPVLAPQGTTPSIEQICWADAQGILMTSGPNQRNTTAPMTLMGLAASFSRDLGNIWGQTEGKEARWYMITGIYGPQGDIDITPNWGRNLTTTGEDSYLSEQLVGAQVNGMQGVGAQSQMKHFTVYNGQVGDTTYQDQWLHEIELAPYEGGYVAGKAAAAMCSYQNSKNLSTYLPGPQPSLWPASPFATGNEPKTWPLNEMHYACEQPMLLNYVLRQQWNSHAYVASDYTAQKSVSAILQGNDQEMPTRFFFSTSNPYGPGGGFLSPTGFDPTGSTCADPNTGLQVACSTPGAIHVAGIPSGSACPLDAANGGGCGLVNAVRNGTMPVSLFMQSLARILYQEERFGLLGCSDNPPSPSCTNPGGNGTTGGDKPGTGTRTGTVPLPEGPTSGAPVLGTKNGDAAIVEKYSEMGATLLKNDGQALPLTSADLDRGVLVTGANANHTVADPTNEASLGFVDRNAVNPLQQLKALSGKPNAFTFVPANDPTGMPVPSSALSTVSGSVTGALARTTGPGAPTQDKVIDFTTVSGNGQLAPGSYTWEGYIYVPTSDTYTFRVESSASISKTNVTFSFDGARKDLINAENVYGDSVPGTPTNAGYTESLLNCQKCALDTDTQGGGFCFPGQVCPPPAPYPHPCTSNLAGGSYHAVKITFNNNTGAPASFRFAYSRANGDIADAAAAAVGKSKAIVFVNDGIGTSSTIPNPYGSDPATIAAPISLSPASTNLINAVAAANPNTIVVLNTANPVLTPWVGSVKSILSMWFAGQEGGTSTARLLLGQANPSGHTAITWPKNATDTIWAYNQPVPLYPGDTAGPHLERYGTGQAPPFGSGGSSSFTQGIYSGYRFFDKMNIEPQFAFGQGLSYTTFEYRNLVLKAQKDGTMRVSFIIQNKGEVAGTAVPQVYVGPAPNVPSNIQQAVRALRGFDRIELRPHEAKRVEITLDARSFQYWDEQAQGWTTAPGTRTIWVGESSRDLRLSGNAAPEKK